MLGDSVPVKTLLNVPAQRHLQRSIMASGSTRQWSKCVGHESDVVGVHCSGALSYTGDALT